MEEQEQPKVTLSGIAFAGAPIVHGTGRVRANFSFHHMLAAARFAGMSGEIEESHAGEALGPFFDEIIPCVAAAIVMSGAGLEAYINELFSDADAFFPEYKQGASGELWDILWEEIERRKSPLEKYELALDLKKQDGFRKDKKSPLYSAYQSARILVELRNALLHFKPQWADEEKSHKSIAGKLLEEGVQTSPFIRDSPHLPTSFMSHDMARWAVKTNLQFTEACSQKAGLNSKHPRPAKPAEILTVSVLWAYHTTKAGAIAARSIAEEGAVAVYMVERDLPGITMEQLAGAQQAAIATSQRFSAEGRPVRYIRSTFVPQEDRCICLFEAADPQLVQEVNDTAQIPYTRVVEARDLTP